MTRAGASKYRFRLWLPAVAIVVLTWLVFLMAQGFPTFCNLVSPCPDPDVRMAPALLFGGTMLVPLILIIFAVLPRNPLGPLMGFGYVALVTLAVMGYVVICFAAGFGVDLPFLIGALAVCGTAGFAFLGASAFRRDRESAKGEVQL